ncbi:conserved hypothetical protein [Hyphomicrobiales bacterium]|jgi:hypothetical protein|nr:conserved hypothetical protein [Hyphomicrobiales bacterium]CAH1702712.1 hypothetical protein BOSEA1005_30584 [Hyphomicrobiales bacterium]CAI0346901.1 conserved hypothetical protein [Hyphomicrobiales bacterium]
MTEKPQSTAAAALAAFFKDSEAVLDFVNSECVGEFPWAIAQGGDQLVISDADRSTFVLIRPEAGGFKAERFHDPLCMVDADMVPDLVVVERADSIEEAFAAAKAELGLSPAALKA